MEWLSPAALWLLPLVGVPFLLQLRRAPVARRDVSSLHLWRAVVRPAQAQPAPRRLRADRLTFTRVALLLALVLALGRPALTDRGPEIALVVDLSPGMGAADGAGLRLDIARTRLREVVRGLPARTTVHLVAAGATPQDLGHFRSDDVALTEALSAVQPVAGRTDIRAALDRAWVHTPNRVWVFSDAPAPGTVPGALTWVTVGKPVPNVGLAALVAQVGDGATEAVATITNSGRTAQEVALALVFEGTAPRQESMRETVRVEAGGERTVVRRVTVPAALVRAQVTAAGDALPSDNERVTVAASPPALRVRLVSDGHPYLEAALRSQRDVVVTRLSPAAAATTSPDDADVVVCDGCAAVPPGAAVLMLPAREVLTAGPAAAVELAQPSHPLARDLDLAAARARPVRAALPEGATVILRAGSAPLLSATDAGGQRIVWLHLTPGDSDLPLQPAFPVLVGNAVDWLSGRHERPTALEAGAPLRWRVTGSALTPPVSVLDPKGRMVLARVEGGTLVTAPLTVPGLYTLRGARGTAYVASQPVVEGVTGYSATWQRDWAVPSGPGASRPREFAMLLLLAGLAIVAIEWRLAHPAPGVPRWSRLTGGVLLLAAAVNLPLPAGSAPLTAVFVLDRSDSVTPGSQRAAVNRVRAMANRMRKGDQAGVVVFGDQAAVDRSPSGVVPAGEPAVQVSGRGSNLAGALNLARQLLPAAGHRRVVVLSDGKETVGQALEEATRAAADGVPIDVALPVVPRVRPVTVRAVRTPSEVKAGEPFLAAVVVEGSPRARAVVLAGFDDEPAQAISVVLGDDGLAQAELAHRRAEPGLYTLSARIEGDDTATDAGATVAVTGPPVALYVGGNGNGDVIRVLRVAGFTVQPTAPSSIARMSSGFAGVDVVVLDDVQADALGTSGLTALRRHVEQEGGGLLLLGGARSLDVPGFGDTPLGPVLPLDLRPRPGRRAPRAAFTLIFDKSGSMADSAGGIPKIELARQAALRVLDVLPATDAFGLIAFDARPVPVMPLGQTRDPAAIADALRRIEPSGSTAVAPAVELASRWLRDAPVDRRHVLLISDGRTEATDLDRLAEATRAGGFELSIIAIGAGADRDVLTRLATGSGGRAYFPEDLRELPALAARDAVRSRGGSAVEERFVLRAGPSHPVLSGLDLQRLPTLEGYVSTTLRPGAQALLLSHLGDPLLAAWQVGLGRTSVYTGDLGSRWSTGLRNWPDSAALWTQTVRWLSRRAEAGAMRLEVGQEGGGLVVQVDVPRATSPAGIGALRAQVRTPSGAVRAVPLRPVTSERFAGRLPADAQGTYRVLASMTDPASGRETRLVGGTFISADTERLSGPPDLALLGSLATLTGGTVLAETAGPFDGRPSMSLRPRSAWLTGASLLLLLGGMMGWPRRTASAGLARTGA